MMLVRDARPEILIAKFLSNGVRVDIPLFKVRRCVGMPWSCCLEICFRSAIIISGV